MNKLEILTRVKEIENTLEQELHKKDDELVFFNNFFENNSLSSIENLINTNLVELFIAYLKSSSNILNIQELREKVESISLIINNFGENEINMLGYTLEELKENIDLEEIKELLNDKNQYRSKWNLQKILNNKQNKINIVSNLLDDNLSSEANIYNLIDLYDLYDEEFDRVLSLIAIIKKLIVEKINYDQQINKLSKDTNIRINDKERKHLLAKHFKENYNINEINKVTKIIKDYYVSYTNLHKNKKMKLKKELINYSNFEKEFLKALKHGEITNFKVLVEKISDKDLKLEVLKFIYRYNNTKYQKLNETYKVLTENADIKYQALLVNYGINKDEYDIDDIKKKSLEDIKKMIDILTKLKVNNKITILTTLKNNNLKTLSNIYNLHNNGILSTNFLEKHISTLNQSNENYQNLLKNINTLKRSNINPLTLSSNPEILLTKSDVFRENIKTLKIYELIPSMKKDLNYNFLENKDLNKIIDMILELGYEKDLLNNLELLNYDKTKWLRIKMLKILNVEIEDVKEILETDKFLIPDNQLEDYIHNVVPQKTFAKIDDLKEKDISHEIEELKDFTYTARTYKINNIIISKNKVQRNLAKLNTIDLQRNEKLFISIVYNSILNDDEFYDIKAIFNNNDCKTYQKA